MKPVPFLYRDPRTLEEALALLREHGDDAAVLAGGQSLIPLMNLRLARPEVVVDVNRVPGVDGLTVEEDRVRLGALARAAVVERDPRVGAALPVLPQALRYVGHPQIRNRSTVGGAVAHADPASELPAVLAALDGWVILRSGAGERTVSWEEFFRGAYHTARRPDEMVVEVGLPRTGGLRAMFVEVARRHRDFALVGACVALRREDGRVGEARIALCGVGGTPIRVRTAEGVLAGHPVTGSVLADLRTEVERSVDPFDDVHATGTYRRAVGGTIVARAVRELWEATAR